MVLEYCRVLEPLPKLYLVAHSITHSQMCRNRVVFHLNYHAVRISTCMYEEYWQDRHTCTYTITYTDKES